MKRISVNMINRKLYLIAAAVVAGILMTVFFPIKDNISVVVEFDRNKDNHFNTQLFWTESGNYSEEQSCYAAVKHNRVLLELSEGVSENLQIRLDPSDVCEQGAITSITILNHGLPVNYLPVRQLLAHSEFVSMEDVSVERGVLSFTPLNEDPSIIFSDYIRDEYFSTCEVRYKIIVCSWIIAVGILLSLAMVNARVLRKAVDYVTKHFWEISCVFLVFIVGIVAYMAFKSFDYSHPDENMSKAAVDYYMTHWKPADIRSADVQDSFSVYGYSRLSEITVYYFLAGKLAWIAKNFLGIAKYYRFFNVFLFTCMVLFYLKRGKNNIFLFPMLGLSPQVWYIFSYTTSDAWDFFCMFFVMYEILGCNSMFNRYIEERFCFKSVCTLLGMGGLFGVLSLGKKNYYFVFVTAFLVLLYSFIKSQKKRLYFLKYLIILCVCAVIFFGMKLYDSHRYDGDKGTYVVQMKDEYAVGEYAADENGNYEQQGIRMKARGVKLGEIFTIYHFDEYSFKSFTGMYGWMEYEGSGGYYEIVKWLYILLMVVLLYKLYKSKNRWLLIPLNLLILAVYGASVLHAWTSDFQPQGRYLFPILGIAACDSCMLNNDNGLVERSVQMTELSLCILGIISFVRYGIMNLIM